MFVGYIIHILDNHEDAKSADLAILHRYGEIREFPFKRVERHASIAKAQRETLVIADDFHIEIVGMGIVHNIHHNFFDHHAELVPTIGHRCHLLCLEDGVNDVKRLALNRLEMQWDHSLASKHTFVSLRIALTS